MEIDVNFKATSINRKKILLGIDKDQKRRKETPAPDLEINGKRLQTMHFDDACRYLGYRAQEMET